MFVLFVAISKIRIYRTKEKSQYTHPRHKQHSLRPCGLYGHSSSLHQREGGGTLLNLGLGGLVLGHQGSIGVVLQLHVVLKVVLLCLVTLKHNVHIGIGIGCLQATGFLIFGLCLIYKFLIVLFVNT